MGGHDLVGLGEVMLRLAAPPPRRLEQTSALDVQIGGAEANVAAARARLGLRRALDEAAGAGVPVSFDVNYRSRLWTPEAAREFLEEILPRLRYLFVGLDDAAAVFKLVGSPGDVLNGLRALAPGAIIALTLGE